MGQRYHFVGNRHCCDGGAHGVTRPTLAAGRGFGLKRAGGKVDTGGQEIDYHCEIRTHPCGTVH